MIEEAMNSKVKGRIVKFLSQQDGEFQVSDIARILKISKSRASETLRELSGMGILSSRNVGRSVLYRFSSNDMARTIRDSVNSDSMLLENIENNVIKEARWLKPVSIVRFGSSLKGLKPHSDVDFLIIHKKPAEKEKIYGIVAKLSSKFGIHISIILMEEKGFIKKARSGDEFALNAMAGKLVHGTDMEDVVWHEK